MMVFQENIPGDVGPVRSSRYYYIAWAAELARGLRPRRRLAAGPRHAPPEGQRPARLQHRRVPLRQLVPPDQDALRAAQPLHDGQAAPAARGGGRGQGRGRSSGRGSSPRTRRSSSGPSAAGSRSTTSPTRSATTTTATTNTYLRSNTAREEADRRVDEAAGRPEERDRDADALRAAERRLEEAPPRGPGHRLRAGLDRDERPDDHGTWKKTALTSPTRFFDKSGKPVTLTVGQTFVQVMPYGSKMSFVAGKPAPSTAPQPARRARPPRPSPS